MAEITLPRAGPNRSRPQRTAAVPTAFDVPTQPTPRDPGVNISTNVPSLDGGIGRALEGAGQSVSNIGVQMAEADNRINRRRASLQRMRDAREFSESLDEFYTEFESTRNLGKQEDLDEFGAEITARAKTLVDNFRGSEEDKLLYAEALEPVLSRYIDRAAVASIKANDAFIDAEHTKVRAGLVAQVRQGLMDPRDAIATGRAFIKKEIDSLRPGQEIYYEQALVSQAWGAKVNHYMATGAFTDAEQLLLQPDVREAIDERNLQQVYDRIQAARLSKGTRTLTEAESVAMGFAPGMIVQQTDDGRLLVAYKPEKDMEVRDKKIQGLKQRYIKNLGMSEEDALNRATDLVDKNTTIEIVPQTGAAREINHVTGEVTEISVGSNVPNPADPSGGETLYDAAETGDVAGVWSGVERFLGETVGQVIPSTVDQKLVERQQRILVAQQSLVRALSNNPRYPVGEMERIREEINIAPSIIDSTEALLARMRGIDEGLRVRLRNEIAAANNTKLPDETRGDAAQAANDIDNFLRLLGARPAGSPKGTIRVGRRESDGRVLWQLPDGQIGVFD